MIRKDVNDALNNLKKEPPKDKEEKRTKSKFDDMSPDELLNAINKENEARPATKKLKKLPPSGQKKMSEPENTAPKKKRIVISGELPDYEAIRQQESEVTEEKTGEPVSVPEESTEKKKGLFSRVKDLMYVSAEDGEENSDTPEEPEVTETPEDNGSFTVEEIEESTASTLESISEALAAINDEVPEKKSEKEPEQVKEPETEKKPEQSEEPEKAPEKKSETSSSRKKKKKKKKSAVNSGEPKKSETKPEEKKTETKPEESSKLEEKKSETKPEESSKPEEKKSETKTEETKSETKPETKSSNSGQKNKKKKKPENSKSAENKDVKKDTEKKVSEEKKKPETPEKESKPDSNSKKKTGSVLDEKPENIVNLREEKFNETGSPAVKNNKYTVLGLICVILAIVGVIAIINTCISNIGGGKSSKEKFAKAVYPAVIMDINSFESPAELPNDQILSAAIWSVVIDNTKLSKYDERMGVVIIPAVDVENFAVELFGEDIPTLTHTTVGPVESKFYYNEEAQSYNIQIKPDTFTYSPEVSSVSKDGDEYTVKVEYVEEHPEWMEKSISKSVEFRLSKNDNGGYKINSMKVLTENS